MDTQPVSVMLTMEARALGALPPPSSANLDDHSDHQHPPSIHHFVVGTSSAQDDSNQLHVFEYNEDLNNLVEAVVYDHPNEIHSISTSHTLPDKVFTCYSTSESDDCVDDTAIALWAIHRNQNDAKADEANDASTRADNASESVRSESQHDHDRKAAPAIDLRSGKTRGSKLRQILRLSSVPFDHSTFAHLPMSYCRGQTQSSPLQLLWNMEASAPTVSSSSSKSQTGDESTVLTLHHGGIATWQIDQGASMIHCTSHSSVPLMSPISCGSWDPHRPQTLAVTGDGTTLRLWDTHSSGIEQAGIIKCAHSDNILSLDFNPNKPHHLTTAGADGQVYVWDLRKPVSPLLKLQGHHHWVTNVRHNRFHDQLLLTSGSEGDVCLWNALSTSSVPSGNALNDVALSSSGADLTSHSVIGDATSGVSSKNQTGAKSMSEKDSDRLIRRYSNFEESVVGLTWSRVHAWVFGTLSVDGRFQVSQVPAAEKYRILL